MFFLHRIVLSCIFHATFKSLLDVIVRCFCLFLHPFHCLSVGLKDKADEPQAHAPHLDLLGYLILQHELTPRAASKISKRSHTILGNTSDDIVFPKNGHRESVVNISYFFVTDKRVVVNHWNPGV